MTEEADALNAELELTRAQSKLWEEAAMREKARADNLEWECKKLMETRDRLLHPPKPRNLTAFAEILWERERQKTTHGWTLEHDDQHEDEELARAAASYAWPTWMRRDGARIDDKPDSWPWREDQWKPLCGNRRSMLLKAGALILAEIERLDRISARATGVIIHDR